MSLEVETRHDSLTQSKSAAKANSPVAYGLGSFGLESTYKVLVGFYMFYYIDVLGLAVAMAAIINIICGIWVALKDQLIRSPIR